MTGPRGEVVNVPFWEEDGVAYIDRDIILGPIEDALAMAEEQERRGSVDRTSGYFPFGRVYADGEVTYSLFTDDFGAADLEDFVSADCETDYAVPPGSYYEDEDHYDSTPLETMSEQMTAIHDAMGQWTNKVPSITFVPFDSSVHSDNLVFKPDTIYSSLNCMYNTTNNRIAVADCDDEGDVVHEIGHAIGMPHEHQTSQASIEIDTSHWGITDFNYYMYGFVSTTPLDYGSIMLYGSYGDKGDWSGNPDVDPSVVTIGGVDYVEMVISDAVYGGSRFQSWRAPGCDRSAHETDIPHVETCSRPFKGHSVTVYCKLSSWDSADDGVDYDAFAGTGNDAVIRVPYDDCYGTMATPPSSAAVENLSNYTVYRSGVDAGSPDLWRDDILVSASATWRAQSEQLSPLDVSAAWTLYDYRLPDGGPAANGEGYGAAVAHGDFDWDGLVDMAVGVPDDDGGSGGVAIYKGVMDTTWGETSFMKWDYIPDVRPWSLEVGDLDGDGYDDLVVGHDPWGGGEGEVLVYMGSKYPTFDNPWSIARFPSIDPARVIIDLGAPGLLSWDSGDYPELGRSLALGDLDGDEKDDLVIGAPGAHAEDGFTSPLSGYVSPVGADGVPDVRENTGAALVLRGIYRPSPKEESSPVDATSLRVLDPYEWTQQGSRVGAAFGTSVALGHLDEDSCLDIVVGAPEDYRVAPVGAMGDTSLKTLPGAATPPVDVHVGQTYVFHGAAGTIGKCGWGAVPTPLDVYGILSVGTLDEEDSEFGYSVATGPVIHEAITELDDLVIGAPGAVLDEHPSLPEAGAAYVYEGVPEIFALDPYTGLPEPDHEYTILSHAPSCPPQDMDRFGHTLEVGFFSGWRGLSGTTMPDNAEVAVGAPYRSGTCGSYAAGAGEGAVYTYSGASLGYAPRDELTLSTGMPSNARYGIALSWQDQGDYWADTADTTLRYEYGQTALWIGAPGANSGTASASGAVWNNDGLPLSQ